MNWISAQTLLDHNKDITLNWKGDCSHKAHCLSRLTVYPPGGYPSLLPHLTISSYLSVLLLFTTSIWLPTHLDGLTAYATTSNHSYQSCSELLPLSNSTNSLVFINLGRTRSKQAADPGTQPCCGQNLSLLFTEIMKWICLFPFASS